MIEYDLKDALRRNPTIIMAGDDICARALERIEELEKALIDIRDNSTSHSQAVEWAFYAVEGDSK